MNFKLMAFILLSWCCFAQKTTLYTIGDSTMADKKNPEKNPEHGWGQLLPTLIDASIVVKNHAVNGRSSRSFINEKRWDTVYNSLKKGDYVFIQFGHNDQKNEDPTRYTNPHTAYRHNLIKFVTESRAKGAIPVLFSSIVRRNFNAKGVLVDTHGEYPLEARLVAQELNVPFVDLQYYSELLEMEYGPEKSAQLHLHFAAGQNPYYSEAKSDDTHLSKEGATAIAKIALEQIKKIDNKTLLKLQKAIK